MKTAVSKVLLAVIAMNSIVPFSKGEPPQADINTTLTKDLATIMFQGNSVAALSALYRDASTLPANDTSRDSLLALSAIGLIALGDDATFRKYPLAIRQHNLVKEVMNTCSRCNGSGLRCPTCNGTGLFPNRGKAQDALQSRGKALLSLFFRQSSFANDQKIAAKIAALPDPLAAAASRAANMPQANAQQQNDQTIIYNGIKMTKDEFRRRLKYEEKFRRVHGFGPDDTPEQIEAAQRAAQAKREWKQARNEARQAEWERQQAEWDAEEASREAQRAQETAEATSRFRSTVDDNRAIGWSMHGTIDDGVRTLKNDTMFDSSPSIRDGVSSIDSGRWTGFDSDWDTSRKARDLEYNAQLESQEAERRREEADRLQREAEERSREASRRADDAWNSWQSY